MTTHKYATPNTVETVLSTELNSLATSAAAVSGAVDNAGGLYKYADFESYCSQSSSPAGNFTIYLQESEDGTNYEDNGANDRAVSQLIGVVIEKKSGFERHVLRHFLLPPTKFKVVFTNYSGSALAASGNTLKMIRYNEADV